MVTDSNTKYKVGQVVKFKTTLRSFGKEEIVFGKIKESFYDKYGQLRYYLEEYPEKSDIMWSVRESDLNSVSLMEM